MAEFQSSFISKAFLRSVWSYEYETFKDSAEDAALLDRLHRWANRGAQNERAAQSALMDVFFGATWGYVQAGQVGADDHYTLHPAFSVAGAGQRGGMGEADAALGFFQPIQQNPIPQVLVEFKDIKSALDAPQRRKGNSRSPVKQGLDYLFCARKGMFGYEPILPTWAIITDMNEFRLYWADKGERQFISFTISQNLLQRGEQGANLLGDDEAARFDRFLFARLFHRDTLIVRGTSGQAALLTLIKQQRFRQSTLEKRFYDEYRSYREHLYRNLLAHNGPDTDRFPGTKGKLVRLAQKLLDRAIFVFFCEDMGRVLGFPPQLLRDHLIRQGDDPFFDPQGVEIWQWLRRLFTAMNEGRAFGDHQINQFNGGLFASDPELECLHIPNSVFCERGQGQNEASLAGNKLTLLYLSANYNYASGWATGNRDQNAPAAKRDPERSIGLYTLGRIFEQSITELEILEAEADERVSLNKESKRKRDGVFYTPEWVVERIVDETVGRRMADMKVACGWLDQGQDRLPTLEAIEAYEAALRDIAIVDPACGSGAFLITALAYLLDEWKIMRELRRQHGQRMADENWSDAAIREILRRNLYGVDINPASVEITKLALWLHTAKANRPLSSLDDHILDGNSLIGPEFYAGNLAPYSDEEQERINAFDWQAAFPEVFARGGFDCVVGNPPYVKLQNFRKVHADMAAHLMRAPADGGAYHSTQTGNFDLYLPFIEKGITLLNDDGRLGYIAPSVWIMNEYGAGLRGQVEAGRHLWGWIDFGAHQIFDEATVYTALQFFSRRANDAVSVVPAPIGVIAESPWAAEDIHLPYARVGFGDRWLLVTGAERDLIDKLGRNGRRLDDPALTQNIFVGIQTSADDIYHLTRLGPNRYEEKPAKGQARGRVVQIEDAIMKPLVSGAEAKRYIAPQTDTYLLFPYRVAEGRTRLIPAPAMEADYPRAWAYLRGHEVALRARENNKMNVEDGWWAYNYPKNLDKQEDPKLLVAQTVQHMQVAADTGGEFYINNVRVNGIAAARDVSPWFLLAALNGRTSDFAFRRTAKPKDGGFFEANKQFIAYLPIPNAPESDRAALAHDAERLQELYTQRRDSLSDTARRLGTIRIRPRADNWLFPDLPNRDELVEQAPRRLIGAERRGWAKARLARLVEDRETALGEHLRAGVALSADLHRGELRFMVDGIPATNGIFPIAAEAPFLLAQWRVLASRLDVTDKMDGKRLSALLKKVTPTAEAHIMADIIALQEAITATEAEITQIETRVNQTIYRLHALTPAEIRMIEADAR
jgi:hypothetical protein